MSTLYLTQQGAVVGKVSNRLKITLQGDVLLEQPLIKVSQVVIFGQATVTPAALRELLKRRIEVCYLSRRGEYIGRVQPEYSKNVLLRVAQYAAMFDDDRCLALARAVVLGKLANLRMTLVRKGPKARKKTIKPAVERLKAAAQAARNAATVNAARGHEGDGSAAYFGVFRHLLKTDAFRFSKRVRRPPTDPINALLSFGYTLLMNDLITAVNLVGFDPYAGYLHTAQYGRPSLALDLMEEFRPIIVDALVLACVNRKILTPASFKQSAAGTFRLTDEGRRAFLEQYEQRRKTEFTHPVLEEKMTYQRAFEVQARLLAHVLQGDREVYPPLLLG